MCGPHPTKPIVTWHVPDGAIKGKSQKGLKDNQDWKKPVLFKQTTHLFFVVFFNSNFCVFFLKKQVFVIFLKDTKTQSQLFLLHYAIHHFQNYTIITCYTYYGIQIWVQRNVPIFAFAKCWSIHSKAVRLSKIAHSKQRKATHTQTLNFHVKFMYMPC